MHLVVEPVIARQWLAGLTLSELPVHVQKVGLAERRLGFELIPMGRSLLRNQSLITV